MVTRTSGARLRNHLEEFRTKHRVPALGGGIVHHDGRFDMAVVGERVRGGGDPVRPDDRWHVGSCGKSITGALYARLVERGDAEWGAPLSALFGDQRDTIHRGWATITIDDLFVCQAGLPANLTRRQMNAGWKDARPLPDQRTDVTATALAHAPHRPGRYLYSNLGYMVIGAAIERITGTTYEAALAAHVLEPLGITSAGFGPPPGLWGHTGRTLLLGPLGGADLGRGKPGDPEGVESDNPAVFASAGRLHLTLEDWARFHRVFLIDGGDFLRPDTIERLLTPAAGRGHRMSAGWSRASGVGSDASFGQQGSNALWVATAVIDKARERTAIVVCNDGRITMLRRTPELAVRLLSQR